MSKNVSRRFLLSKIIQVGSASLLSKILGILREILLVNYFGKPGVMSDAFTVAFKVPTLLRKIFAEGALSSALIPTLVQLNKEDLSNNSNSFNHKSLENNSNKSNISNSSNISNGLIEKINNLDNSKNSNNQADKLVTLLIFTLSAIVLILCAAVIKWTTATILFVAPGYVNKPEELAIAVPLLKILIFFVFFVSSAALFSSALQAKQHFLVPSWGPIILNIAYIIGLLICIKQNLQVNYLILFILLGGFFQVAICLLAYFKMDLRFSMPDRQTFKSFRHVIFKFIPCLFAVGASEINLFIDTQFASTLAAGQYTLMGLAYRFMAIALSIFAVAFSTVLLPHFSKVTSYAPKRLGYYFLESIKLVVWLTLPVILLMSFFASDIFYTIFFRCTRQFTLENVADGALLLRGFVWALSFYSINKIFLSIFYARHSTLFPSIVAAIGAFINAGLNWFIVPKFGALGLAIDTSIGEIIQTIIFSVGLVKLLDTPIYFKNFLNFLKLAVMQVSIFALIFWLIYKIITKIIEALPFNLANLILYHLGLWLWVGPLILVLFYFMYKTRKMFGIKIYFLGS